MALFLGLGEEELQVFLDETLEHLDILEADLLDMEKNGPQNEQVARTFRAAHTMKGAAAAVGLEQMADITHAMENIFDRVRAGTMMPTPPVVDILLQAVDFLRLALSAVADHRLPEDAPAGLMQALQQIDQAAQASPALTVKVAISSEATMPAVRALQVLLALKGMGEVVDSQPAEAEIRAGHVGENLEIRLHTDKSKEEVRQALARISEISDVSLSGDPSEMAEVLKTATPALGVLQPETIGKKEPRSPEDVRATNDRTIRVDVAILDDLMNLVGELVIDRGRLGGIGQALAEKAEVEALSDDLAQVTAHLARVSGALQERVLQARMLPVQHVFRKFPRMVRDLAQQTGKQVDFRMSGEDTELDRSLLEVLGDALMHLLRNSVDHGIESPEERLRVGKPEAGILQLTAGYEENQVVILVQDDGKGIDSQRVRTTAIRKGILSEERARELNEQEVIQLLFASGFSTSNEVTDVSGRGVGLDVVRRNIERVGGRIEVESQAGMGTTFRLLLPLTLATIQALLVEVGDDILAMPLSAIAEALHVSQEDISRVGGRWMTTVRGRVVPLIWLRQFRNPSFRPERPSEDLIAVLANHKNEQVGLVVDRLVGEQEVVVKGLGEFLGQVRGISGATILGDGSLALILDMGGLISMLVAENASTDVVDDQGQATLKGAVASGAKI